MVINTHSVNNFKIAEIISDRLVVETESDGLDLLGNLLFQGYDAIVIYEKDITTAFFELKNGMAGEILQKFSNYRTKLAIVGDFIPYQSGSIKSFMIESNRTKHINFSSTLQEAIKKLTTNG